MIFSDFFHIFINLAIQYFSFILIFYFLNDLKVKTTVKEVLLGTLFVFVPAMILYFFFPMGAIIYLFFSQFAFLYIRHSNFTTLTFLSISIIIGICSDHLASIILFKTLTLHVTLFFYLRLIIYLVISFCLAYIIKRLIHYLHRYLDQKMALIFTVVSILMISLFYLNIYPYLMNGDIGLLLANGTFILLLTGGFFTLSFMLIRVKMQRYQMKSEKQEYEHFKSYVAAVEQINSDMQKFRHDYLNVLLSMKGFIQARDMDGLADYFDEGILKFEHKTLLSSKVLKTLERLKNPSLKGLLFNKFIYGHEQDIPITLEIAEPIHLPKIKSHIELIRIVGILLDNAIDNSTIHPSHRIEIAMVNLNDSVLLVIRNQINPTKFDIKKIFDEGYTTKGKGRGIGLSNIKSIIGNVEELSMHYWVEDGWYNVELFIKGEN